MKQEIKGAQKPREEVTADGASASCKEVTEHLGRQAPWSLAVLRHCWYRRGGSQDDFWG